ncbi:hypothetical protein [Holospora curviuscula]|nr:hypothetical protein [Holospora curviuscula]
MNNKNKSTFLFFLLLGYACNSYSGTNLPDQHSVIQKTVNFKGKDGRSIVFSPKTKETLNDELEFDSQLYIDLVRKSKNAPKSLALFSSYSFNNGTYVQLSDFNHTGCVERALGLTPDETYTILQNLSKEMQESFAELQMSKFSQEAKNLVGILSGSNDFFTQQCLDPFEALASISQTKDAQEGKKNFVTRALSGNNTMCPANIDRFLQAVADKQSINIQIFKPGGKASELIEEKTFSSNAKNPTLYLIKTPRSGQADQYNILVKNIRTVSRAILTDLFESLSDNEVDDALLKQIKSQKTNFPKKK